MTILVPILWFFVGAMLAAFAWFVALVTFVIAREYVLDNGAGGRVARCALYFSGLCFVLMGALAIADFWPGVNV